MRFDPSGGLWLDDGPTLILADLHLGYAWAQRRRGGLGPVVEGGSQQRLWQLVDSLRPRRVVLLGDIVHAPRPSPDERATIQQTLQGLADRAELICVMGNHDRAFPSDFPAFPAVSEWRSPGVLALHGDRLPAGPEPGVATVVGHFHPAIRIKTASGASHRLKAFLQGGELVVLPAFSPFAAGTDMRRDMPPELRAWFGALPVRALVTDGQRLLPVSLTPRPPL